MSQANMSGECEGVTICVNMIRTMQVGSREPGGELGMVTGRTRIASKQIRQRLQWLWRRAQEVGR